MNYCRKFLPFSNFVEKEDELRKTRDNNYHNFSGRCSAFLCGQPDDGLSPETQTTLAERVGNQGVSRSPLLQGAAIPTKIPRSQFQITERNSTATSFIIVLD